MIPHIAGGPQLCKILHSHTLEQQFALACRREKLVIASINHHSLVSYIVLG